MNLETDPKMPWNQRTFLDTFWKNAAFDKLALDMIVTMNEIRMEKAAKELSGPPGLAKSYEEQAREYYNKYGTSGEF